MNRPPLPGKQVRATRVAPQPSFKPGATRPGGIVLVLLVVLLIAASSAAGWFGTRAVQLERELGQRDSLLTRSAVRLATNNEFMGTLADAGRDLSVTHLTADSSTGGVTVFWNQRDRSAVANAYGLERVHEDSAYFLWMVDTLNARLIGEFVPDARGRATLPGILIPPAVDSTAQLVVNVERVPAGLSMRGRHVYAGKLFSPATPGDSVLR